MNDEQRVAAGAALLDERSPNWYVMVDAETLDLRDDERCILGQLHGEFSLGMVSLFSADADLGPEAVKHGFLISARTIRFRHRYNSLTVLWCHEIIERLEAELDRIESFMAVNDLSGQSGRKEAVCI